DRADRPVRARDIDESAGDVMGHGERAEPADDVAFQAEVDIAGILRVGAEPAERVDVQRKDGWRNSGAAARVDLAKIAFDCDTAEVVTGGVDVADISQPIA